MTYTVVIHSPEMSFTTATQVETLLTANEKHLLISLFDWVNAKNAEIEGASRLYLFEGKVADDDEIWDHTPLNPEHW